jgi:hypothetical protein
VLLWGRDFPEITTGRLTASKEQREQGSLPKERTAATLISELLIFGDDAGSFADMLTALAARKHGRLDPGDFLVLAKVPRPWPWRIVSKRILPREALFPTPRKGSPSAPFRRAGGGPGGFHADDTE